MQVPLAQLVLGAVDADSDEKGSDEILDKPDKAKTAAASSPSDSTSSSTSSNTTIVAEQGNSSDTADEDASEQEDEEVNSEAEGEADGEEEQDPQEKAAGQKAKPSAPPKQGVESPPRRGPGVAGFEGRVGWLPRPLEQVMKGWLHQPGYPLVTVYRDLDTGAVTVSQVRGGEGRG